MRKSEDSFKELPGDPDALRETYVSHVFIVTGRMRYTIYPYMVASNGRFTDDTTSKTHIFEFLFPLKRPKCVRLIGTSTGHEKREHLW